MRKINIAEEFNKFTGPRYKKLGDFSGELFREDFLVPALDGDEDIEVELDGLVGIGSSFLEEAFGGLIRDGYPRSKVKAIRIHSNQDENLIYEVTQYIDNAQQSVAKKS